MLTSSYPRHPDDGAGSFVRSLAKHIAARGHLVRVLAPHDGGRPCPPEDERVQVTFFRYAPAARLRVVGYGRSLQEDVRLRPAVYPSLCGYLVAGLITAVRAVLSSHCDLLHAHWVVPSGFLGAIAARSLRVPLVVSLHGSDMYLASKRQQVGHAARFAFSAAAAVTACSEDLRERAAIAGAGQKATLIPYGVDPDLFAIAPETVKDIRRSLGIGDQELVVVAVGRLVRKKGFDYLLRAWPTISQRAAMPVRLVIGGDGDLRDELEGLARRAGTIREVRFAGALPWSEVAAWLATSDVVVVPSIRDDWGNVDGLPNVLLEAMAAARPVVATQVGGIPSVISHGHNGLLVPERSSEALAKAILELLDAPAQRQSLGMAARETVERGYSWAAVAEQFCRLYSTVIGSLK